MTTVKQRVSADLRALEWWGSFEGDDGVNSSKETIKLNNRPNMFSRCSFQLPFYSRYSSIDWLTDCFCICFCFALLSLGTKKMLMIFMRSITNWWNLSNFFHMFDLLEHRNCDDILIYTQYYFSKTILSLKMFIFYVGGSPFMNL